jgi:hypothetical protein
MGGRAERENGRKVRRQIDRRTDNWRTYMEAEKEGRDKLRFQVRLLERQKNNDEDHKCENDLRERERERERAAYIKLEIAR